MLDQQRVCALAYAAAFVMESALLFLTAKRRLGLHLFVWRPRPR
jgi:hypothetical protein